ncbi:MAG: hypothetical protein HWD92_10945 [Flavobacteriia bacterium]|nr:hypothetical protein [Flavobacteriia bacterium]
MRIIAAILLSVLSLSMMAQRELQSRYPFMHLEDNRIQVLGDDDKVEDFFEKLDDLAFNGEGNISILHMGGSHVQAGTLSQAMREGMHAMSPGLKGNRGFFFPFRLAHTNEPRNFSISSTGDWDGYRCSVNNHSARWGMSGIVATTTDADSRTTIVAYDGDTGKYRFSTIRIYHPSGGEYYHPIIDSNQYTVDTIFFDSRGFTEFRFRGNYSEFVFELDGSDSAESFVWQGVEFVNDWPGMSYHAIGVNGASTKSYLRCEDFESQIKALAPDLVVFGIGINDAYMSQDRFEPEVFKARYDSLMDMLEAANPSVVFLFLTNNDSYYRRRYPNPNALEVQRVMKELAEERDGMYWDLFEVMGGLGSVDLWVDRGLARSDRIHMSPDGYRLQAELLTYAIERAWLNHLEEHAR